MFSPTPPPPPYCKVETRPHDTGAGCEWEVVSPHSPLFQPPRAGPPRRGWCVQGRGVGSGLWSMKPLQCFNRKVTVASSILDVAASGRLASCCIFGYLDLQ